LLWGKKTPHFCGASFYLLSSSSASFLIVRMTLG
jgi:hypothetical protein